MAIAHQVLRQPCLALSPQVFWHSQKNNEQEALLLLPFEHSWSAMAGALQGTGACRASQ